MPEPPLADLELLVRIAHAVQGVVRQSRGSPHRGDMVGMGADGSPTEEVDRIAEGRVLSILESEGVDWNVLSEEIGTVQRGGARTLVVDPIDGSHNVLRGMPFATISLALGSGTLSGVDVGVVHDLFTGTTFWASRGGGAFCDGLPIRVRPWELRRELFFVNLGRHSTSRALRLAERGRRIRSLGCASLEMVMVAQGAADAYLFDNDTPNRNLRVTDIAAAFRIVGEAGGFVGDASFGSIENFPLQLGTHTSVCAWGDAAFPSSVHGPEAA
ncbi:MAG TPA: inositol monophosphatase family protein [Thermoplasmata archaeon]|nr:inositol monophosphatase family protein [Thermoplasmata archaeon]